MQNNLKIFTTGGETQLAGYRKTEKEQYDFDCVLNKK